MGLEMLNGTVYTVLIRISNRKIIILATDSEAIAPFTYLFILKLKKAQEKMS